MATPKRSIETINAEIAVYGRQFQAEIIPAGTPDRKRLQREANAAAHERACRRENIERRIALADELRKAEAAAKRRATLAAKAADPRKQTRQWLMRWLRKLGFRRDTRTSSGSTYYTYCNSRVRISDHDVPETDERRHNAENGGFSWATQGWNLRIDASRMDLARDLVAIRKEVKTC